MQVIKWMQHDLNSNMQKQQNGAQKGHIAGFNAHRSFQRKK
jgi:hypothetical protein